MRYLIKFSYDGTCFDGYQRQPHHKTIQGEIEKALTSLEGKKCEISSSGRTDKGVHAINQYAHFDLTKDVKLYNLKKYLNNKLNGEIHIKEVIAVTESFHARYDVKSKTYEYYINIGEYNPIKRNYEYQYNKPLNIRKMKKATKCLIGEHDFRSFCKDEKLKENCIRKIYDIKITKKENIIIITFKGNGFLRKMIRNIIGILIEIGKGNKEISYMNEILNKNKRLGNMKSVPSCGLYLKDVSYID